MRTKFMVLCLAIWLSSSLAFTTAPTITSFKPTSGTIGQVVTLTGTNFTGVTSVKFNGVVATTFTMISATSITAKVPSGATTGKIAVTTPDGTATSTTDFSFSAVLGTAGINPTDKAAIVWVPGGTFTMGSSDGVGFKDEHPAHQVTLSGYWIYKYEVTVAQYLAFCAATKHALPLFPSPRFSWTGKTGWDDPILQQHPIVNVSWFDAKAYANWAKVALPSEAQWEYAARGQQGRNYPWGGTATTADQYNGWNETKCANVYNSFAVKKSTWPVGSFPSGVSWCGAQDLVGNVWEWCSDWYGKYSSSPVTNPTGPAKGDYRVLRGGSWYYYLGNYNNRGAYRNGWCLGNPGYRNDVIGFRCVAVSPGR